MWINDDTVRDVKSSKLEKIIGYKNFINFLNEITLCL